jgi:rRNA pseudouridine-1189 N-methylase Emg1 (Nep1/Mra1 family)
MLHLVLADCELERVPPEIADHRVIRWWARRRGRRPTELLLDSSLFYPALRAGWRTGGGGVDRTSCTAAFSSAWTPP